MCIYLFSNAQLSLCLGHGLTLWHSKDIPFFEAREYASLIVLKIMSLLNFFRPAFRFAIAKHQSRILR
ncbi:hypothetical protein BCT30_16020 [Enterovibrio norvegicus]|nr:hypothetical protein A1OS_21275 [Enterovibrio norvegicus]OEF49465.1 hypothetical protein A1OW_12555 [Enterovibrio norvegicus]OEF56611.1 hypothetical protein A1OU_17800 [Enterovibrio norvegicus]PMH61409.1 hypothetical protein BCU62_20590 [Enterovibrio norvegicus]PMI30837.1 hypothetical protein BCU47_17030 [Enterovibrio norvegicus]